MDVADANQATRRWFAVHTKPRHEAVAEEQLKRQGYNVYYPRLLQTKRQRGCWRRVIEPLFPRYLFVRLREGMDNFAPIRSTIGVSDLVRVGRNPKSVSENIISELRGREDQAQGMIIGRSQWKEGMPIEFIKGPLAGLHGIFSATNGDERALILLRLLGQVNEVIVSQDSIIPA